MKFGEGDVWAGDARGGGVEEVGGGFGILDEDYVDVGDVFVFVVEVVGGGGHGWC